jgi:hypothetical protein
LWLVRATVAASLRSSLTVSDAAPKVILTASCGIEVLRKTIRGNADGTDEPVLSTIEDSAVLDALRPVLAGGS